LTTKYGLLMDSLLEAEVVLSNGEVKRCSEKENDDLFWGIRGGGRWLCCVTRFKFKVYSKNSPDAVSAVMPFPVHSWEKVLRACHKRQDEHFNYTFSIVSHPVLVDVTVCLVHAVFFDGIEKAKIEYEKMIQEIGESPMNGNSEKVLHELSWPRINRAMDNMVPWSVPMHTQNFNIADDGGLDHVIAFLDMTLRRKPAHIIITLDHLGSPGFSDDSSKAAKTMWNDRTPFFCGMFLCTLNRDNRSQTKEASKAFIKAVLEKTAEHQIPPRSVNSEEYASLSSVYGDEIAERFLQVKDKYDRIGFFTTKHEV